MIDAGADGEELLKFLKAEELVLDALLNTHGHGDHIGALDYLRQETGAKLYIHKADAPMLRDAKLNLSAYMGMQIEGKEADVLLEGGEELDLLRTKIKVIHTPGHSPGGVCYLFEDRIFTGDSLFYESIGRCDFPNSSMQDLVKALKEKILPLSEEMPAYPGHGPATMIGHERQYNPYLMTTLF